MLLNVNMLYVMANSTEKKFKDKMPFFATSSLCVYDSITDNHCGLFGLNRNGLTCKTVLKNKTLLNYAIHFQEHNYKYDHSVVGFWFQYGPQESQMCMLVQRSQETDILQQLKCLQLALCI
jgi:hypothetical protein